MPQNNEPRLLCTCSPPTRQVKSRWKGQLTETDVRREFCTAQYRTYIWVIKRHKKFSYKSHKIWLVLAWYTYQDYSICSNGMSGLLRYKEAKSRTGNQGNFLVRTQECIHFSPPFFLLYKFGLHMDLSDTSPIILNILCFTKCSSHYKCCILNATNVHHMTIFAKGQYQWDNEKATSET